MPFCIVTVNGQPMSAPFYSRLVSAELTDNEGVESDTCRITLNDGPESGGYLAIPDRGAIITVAMGMDAPTLMGQYELDEVEIEFKPYGMTLSGKSIDVRKGMKTNKERHWDDKTLGDIVNEIAGEHGLSANISESIGSHFEDYWIQNDESDLNFLERQAERFNATFAVKNGQLLFVEKGSGESASGQAMSALVVTLADVAQNTGRVQLADRSVYKDAVAYFQDKDGVQRKEFKVEIDPDGEATYRLGYPYQSEEAAKKAAGSKAKSLQRATDRLSVTVIGNPGAIAGSPIQLVGVRPEIDSRNWIIKTATHRFDKSSGYTTSIEAETKA